MFGFRRKFFSGFGQITFLVAGFLTTLVVLIFFSLQFLNSGFWNREASLIKELSLKTTPSVLANNPQNFLAKIFASPKAQFNQYEKREVSFNVKKPASGSVDRFLLPLPGEFFELKNNQDSGSIEPGPLQKLVISEVLFGTEDSAKEEFIEIFNPNDFAVDVLGWELRKKTESGNDSVLVSSQKFFGSIGIKSYFLITHPDFQDKSGADLVWSSKSYSISENNVIYLLDNFSRRIDLVGCGSAFDYEGAACSVPESGISVSRSQNIDTDNNQKDFVFSQSSPKSNFIAYVSVSSPPPAPALDSTGSPQASPVFSLAPSVVSTPALSPPVIPSPSLSPTSEPLITPSIHPQALLHQQIIEIQFGVEENTNADFVKMFNPNELPLDLKDYKLVKKTASSGNETSLKSWRNDGTDAIISDQSYFYWINSSYQEKIEELQQQGIKFFANSATITETNGIGLKYQDILVESENW